jgi:hypothetical protein
VKHRKFHVTSWVLTVATGGWVSSCLFHRP